MEIDEESSREGTQCSIARQASEHRSFTFECQCPAMRMLLREEFVVCSRLQVTFIWQAGLRKQRQSDEAAGHRAHLKQAENDSRALEHDDAASCYAVFADP